MLLTDIFVLRERRNMKIEVLSDSLNSQIRGKHVKEENLRKFLKSVVSDITIKDNNDSSSLSNETKLVMACQMLWNELEDVKAKLKEFYERT